MWIETAANIVQASAVSIAAYAAWRGIDTWRRETVGRRNAEVAEQALSAFYKARIVLNTARIPGSFSTEGKTRESVPGETEEQKSYRDSVYAVIERLERHSDFWSEFEAMRFVFQARFGASAAEPFDEIMKIHWQIYRAAVWLIRTYGTVNIDVPGNIKRREKWEAEIGQGLEDADEIEARITKAVEAIELSCRPAIAGSKV